MAQQSDGGKSAAGFQDCVQYCCNHFVCVKFKHNFPDLFMCFIVHEIMKTSSLVNRKTPLDALDL